MRLLPYVLYLKYLLRHKWFVGTMCVKYGLYWQALVHDLSKFRPSEFIPYARYFYGTYPTQRECDRAMHLASVCIAPSKEVVVIAFNHAWLLHQHRNPHHWQHWILREDSGKTFALDMPTRYLLEMLCDWWGAGRAMGRLSPSNDVWRETRNWYEKTKDNMLLSDSTRRYVETFLKVN
jgi:hypothetical protein